jgi:putative ABC transport system permease protein
MSRRSFQILLRSLPMLWRYPLRSGLLALSAALGVSGVVCSVNYAAGGSRQLLEQIRRMGTAVLILTPADSRAVAGRVRTGAPVTTLVEPDYIAIRREVRGRTRSSALVTASFRLKAGDLSKNAAVVGCEPDFFAIKDWPVAQGEAFDSAQERSAARVALLGHTVALDLFGDASPVGAHLLINRVPFTVLGVLSERGQGLDVSSEDNQVYVPLATAMRRLLNADHYGGIVLEMGSLGVMDDAAATLRSLLRRQHHIAQNQPDDFQIQNQKALLDTQRAAATRLRFLLFWVGASALGVSGLGILGITWIAVRERTREIGTRRALGARAADVFLQTLFESATVALLGGLAGFAAAWPASRAISDAARLPFVFDRGAAALALAAAVLLNVGFSLMPARLAARMHPTEALRYE